MKTEAAQDLAGASTSNNLVLSWTTLPVQYKHHANWLKMPSNWLKIAIHPRTKDRQFHHCIHFAGCGSCTCYLAWLYRPSDGWVLVCKIVTNTFSINNRIMCRMVESSHRMCRDEKNYKAVWRVWYILIRVDISLRLMWLTLSSSKISCWIDNTHWIRAK